MPEVFQIFMDVIWHVEFSVSGRVARLNSRGYIKFLLYFHEPSRHIHGNSRCACSVIHPDVTWLVTICPLRIVAEEGKARLNIICNIFSTLHQGKLQGGQLLDFQEHKNCQRFFINFILRSRLLDTSYSCCLL